MAASFCFYKIRLPVQTGYPTFICGRCAIYRNDTYDDAYGHRIAYTAPVSDLCHEATSSGTIGKHGQNTKLTRVTRGDRVA